MYKATNSNCGPLSFSLVSARDEITLDSSKNSLSVGQVDDKALAGESQIVIRAFYSELDPDGVQGFQLADPLTVNYTVPEVILVTEPEDEPIVANETLATTPETTESEEEEKKYVVKLAPEALSPLDYVVTTSSFEILEL